MRTDDPTHDDEAPTTRRPPFVRPRAVELAHVFAHARRSLAHARHSLARAVAFARDLPRTHPRESLAAGLSAAALLLFTSAAILAHRHPARPTIEPAPATAPRPIDEPPPPPPPARDPEPAPRSLPVATSVPLTISTTPPDAWIRVDDERHRHHSPFTVTVPAGAHVITVERPRYTPARLRVDAPAHVAVPLERPPATLRLRTTPPGAAARVDGHDAGRTPLDVATTAYEQHRIELALGATVVHRRVYVRPPVHALDVKLRVR